MSGTDKRGEEALGQSLFEDDLNSALASRADALPDPQANPSEGGKSHEDIVASEFGGVHNDLVDMTEIAGGQGDPAEVGDQEGQFGVRGDRSAVPPIKEGTGEI